MDAKTLIETKVRKKLAERPEIGRGVNAVVAIELAGPGGGRWALDFTKSPPTFAEDAGARAATTIAMDAAVFVEIAIGKADAQTSFLMGKIRVDGDLGLAIKLGELLG